jgi:hypothetical protein
MSSAILAWGFDAFAAISSLRQHHHIRQPVLDAPALPPSPADSLPVSIPRPSSLGAWTDSGLDWRRIELLGRRRSRTTAKRVAA